MLRIASGQNAESLVAIAAPRLVHDRRIGMLDRRRVRVLLFHAAEMTGSRGRAVGRRG